MATWHAMSVGGYSRDTQEAHDNAVMIASILMSKGWSLQSICGVLGNIQGEGAMNPWRWDSNTYFPTEQQALQDQAVYGLFNYTPFMGYRNLGNSYPGFGINYNDGNDNNTGSILDGQAQILFMHDDIFEVIQTPYTWSQNIGHYYDYEPYFSQDGISIDFIYGVNGYTAITKQEFIEGVGYTPEEMALVFELCYEHPAAYAAAGGFYQFRAETARYYYDYLSTVPIPPFVLDSKTKWIYWLKPRWKRWL